MNDCSAATTGKCCVFGLDYDDTFSADPQLWRRIIELMEAAGHIVLLVTCRHDTAENRADIEPQTGLKRYRHLYTGMSPKRHYCESKGWSVDVWIDDFPESVTHGR